MSPYSENVVSNVDFLGERARDLADQEVDRARTLDTKAGAISAGCVALIGASAGFATKLSDTTGGSGAKTLLAIELSFTVTMLLVGGALAVWALTPKVFRTTVAFHELETWANPRVLEADPAMNRGKQLRASIHSVGVARVTNEKKAERVSWAFRGFAAALVGIVALSISIGVHAAAFDSHGSHRAPAGEFNTSR